MSDYSSYRVTGDGGGGRAIFSPRDAAAVIFCVRNSISLLKQLTQTGALDVVV